MTKLKLFALLTVLLFVSSALVVAPRAVMANTINVDAFEDKYLQPYMYINASYFEPLSKGGATIIRQDKVYFTFSEVDPSQIEPLKVPSAIVVSEGVRDYLLESPADQIIGGFTPTDALRHHDWFNGTITYEPLDFDRIAAFTTSGKVLKGYFFSANQLADYVAWQNGYTVNEIFSCEHGYEVDETKLLINGIYETELPNMTVTSTYDTGQLLVEQEDPTLLKGLTPPSKQLFLANVTLTSLTSKPFGGIALLIAFGIGAIGSLILKWFLDPTPYSQDDLEYWYERGYKKGVEESVAWYNARLLMALNNGSIDNMTYCYLMGLFDNAYNEIIKGFKFPTDFPHDGGNSWWEGLLEIVQTAIIIVIIVVVVIVCLWILQRSGLLSRKGSGGSGTIQIINTGGRIVAIIRSLFLFGLQTGAL